MLTMLLKNIKRDLCMNKRIDTDKMFKILRGSNMEHLAKRIVESDVVDCSECQYKYKDNTVWCTHSKCIHNPYNKQPDYFTIKECEHVWFYITSGKVTAKRKCSKCGLIQWAKFDEIQ